MAAFFYFRGLIHSPMRNFMALFISLFLTQGLQAQSQLEYAIVIHGGAGNVSPQYISPERAAGSEEKLTEALDAGLSLLEAGGSSLDAVEKVIRILEDSPLFNAGKGAVFNNAGRNELDACIMGGESMNAGGVTCVGDIKNPISAARAVMEKSPHVLLTGAGASDFAARQGIEIVDSDYFHTEKRWKDLQEQLKKDSVERYGTVGCVALDKAGNLAAGTSTGGITNKSRGRVGDTPIPGAGNYASNQSCAVSGTGHGEYFIRYTVGRDIAALMEYRGLTIEEAAREVIHEKLKPAGGKGGVICIDKYGNMAMEFNTAGMKRAWGDSSGKRGVKIFDQVATQ
jgi:beta-aspartyl-peptidase (threonine type)